MESIMSVSGINESKGKNFIDDLIGQTIGDNQQLLNNAISSIGTWMGDGRMNESDSHMMKVQAEQQNQMQVISLLTNILRNAHEMAMTVIRNLRL
jgi:serine protease inhibitor